jgi:hypothetical protein
VNGSSRNKEKSIKHLNTTVRRFSLGMMGIAGRVLVISSAVRMLMIWSWDTVPGVSKHHFPSLNGEGEKS